MSWNGRDDDAKLEAIDLFVIDQILNATDEEMLDQAGLNDPEKVDEAFRKAKLAAGKSKMANARSAVARSTPTTNVPLDPVRMRQRLNNLVMAQGEHGQRLTLAARSAKGNVDADDEGILEDLNDLLGDDDENEHP